MTIPINTEFVNYVDSFYGTNDPIYPMMHQETKQPLNVYDIVRAIHTYIERIEKGDLEYVHYSWGDGDSLDRERVRDILLEEYNYKYVPDSFNMSDMKWVSQYALCQFTNWYRATSIGVFMYYNEYMNKTTTQFQLFLGRNIPDAGKVTQEMMNDFIADEVATRFDGFTVTEGTGFWKGKQEKVAIITFITADGSTKVQEIADSFKESFRQDSVLMTETQLPVCQLILWHNAYSIRHRCPL